LSKSIISPQLEALLKEMRSQVAELQVRPSAIPQTKPVVVSRGCSREKLIQLLMEGVESRFGIQPNNSVERKLENTLAHLDQESLFHWCEQLMPLPGNHHEWLGLVECLTVHETYFCRDMPTLDVVRKEIFPQIVSQEVIPDIIRREAKRNTPAIRIWSAACSTGEETYTLLFLLLEALLEAGHAYENNKGEIIPDSRWLLDVVGSDLSAQVLGTARGAVYSQFGLGSFREMPARFWRFFEAMEPSEATLPGAKYWKVRDFVTRLVRFQKHNLLSGEGIGHERDLTMCRNVMIYFDMDAKRQAQELLTSSLRSGGYLILGNTDPQLLPDHYTRRINNGVSWFLKR